MLVLKKYLLWSKKLLSTVSARELSSYERDWCTETKDIEQVNINVNHDLFCIHVRTAETQKV